MSISDLLAATPGSPIVSGIAWTCVAVGLLYLARNSAHQALLALGRAIYTGARLGARSIALAERRLAERNRDVLLAAGQEAVERELEREFHRVGAVVERDLSGYPALNRALTDLATRIDDDYRASTETPPAPPGWVEAVDAVARIPRAGDSLVSKVLTDIHTTVIRHHGQAIDEYRKASRQRHGLLRRMMPYWRRMTQTLSRVESTMSGLLARAAVIDKKMAEYEAIRARTETAVRTLSSSSMTQFVVSAFVLVIAAAGAMINFNLIALPMSEMVGGGSYIGSFQTSHVAALVIILVEAAMGLYLMEALRITQLFPAIGSMSDTMRVRMIWVTFSILFVLASVESALAFMRDLIAADLQALRQALADQEVVTASHRWIPTVGQMLMGFILPFALTFVAIPLESFIQSSRTVFGAALAWSLRSTVFALRFSGSLAKSLSRGSTRLYDLLIFPLLWVEAVVRDHGQRQRSRSRMEAR